MVQGNHHPWLCHLTRAYLFDETGHVVEAGRVFKAGRVHDCQLCFGNCALGRPMARRLQVAVSAGCSTVMTKGEWTPAASSRGIV